MSPVPSIYTLPMHAMFTVLSMYTMQRKVSSAHDPLPALMFHHIFFLLSKDMVTLE